MGEIIHNLPRWYKWCLVMLFVIFWVAFLTPPPFQIDNNIIAAIAELGFFSMIGLLPGLLKSGHSVEVSKGDTTIKVSKRGEEVPEESVESIENL